MVPQAGPEAVRICFYDKATGGPVMSPTAIRVALGVGVSPVSPDDPGIASYQVASALVEETESVCGGSWWTGLFRGGLHSA